MLVHNNINKKENKDNSNNLQFLHKKSSFSSSYRHSMDVRKSRTRNLKDNSDLNTLEVHDDGDQLLHERPICYRDPISKAYVYEQQTMTN